MAFEDFIETRIARIYRDKNEIVVVTMKDCANVDEYDIADLHLVVWNISNQKPAYKLLDARANWNMDKKAKERSKQEPLSASTLARAVVVSDSLSAGLLSFIQGFSKSSYPHKTFSDWDKAYAWLMELKSHSDRSKE